MKNFDRKLLTIAIPTFNRCKSLKLLLDSLSEELIGIEEYVSVIISDNASIDDTSIISRAFSRSYEDCRVVRHLQNIGMDENFVSCVKAVQTKYFWIVGDDDIPEKNSIKLILELLVSKNPDLIYLNNKTLKNLYSLKQRKKITNLSYIQLTEYNFLQKTNIWTTFISGSIVNLDTYKKRSSLENIGRFSGTYLSQLEWVYEVILSGKKFFYVETRCILAHANNSSGGYKLISVFSKNFKTIVGNKFNNNKKCKSILLSYCFYGYIPILVYKLRFKKFGDFADEDYIPVLKDAYESNLFFWLIIIPICKLPLRGAYFFAGISKLLTLFHYLLKRLLIIFIS